MWTKFGISALSAGLLLVAQVAQADPWDARNGYDNRGADYDYARVLSSQPITRRVRVTEPRRECYEETRYGQARYNDGGDYRASGERPAAGSMILGGLIGAVIGHQIGRGDGRRAATAAGALIGAAVGHDAAGRNGNGYAAASRYDDDRPTTVQHCDVRYDESWEERVEAYLVTYEYNGRRYTTRMNYDPGPRLRVSVAVRPDGQ